LIVTAAYGSPNAPEVRRLQYLRDELLRTTPIGDALFREISAEYYRFSPRVAEEIESSAALRGSVARVVVQPLLGFFALLEEYVAGGWCDANFVRSAEAALMRHLVEDWGGTYGARSVGVVCAEMRRLKDSVGTLVGEMPGGLLSPLEPLRVRDDCEAGDLVDYLVKRIQHSARGTAYLDWAVLAPLEIYWSALAQVAVHETGAGIVGRTFIDELRAWLGAVPIPEDFTKYDEAAVRESLVDLSRMAFTDPRVRQAVGVGLITNFEKRVSYDLRATLFDTGYVLP
jgi:hypothetical protein